jgi:hypothetical protein
MDYKHFENLYRQAKDTDYSERCMRLSLLRKFLDGTAYDILEYPFVYVNKVDGGGSSGNPYSAQKIGMMQRRPSVISTLCGTVVEDSVAFLFGEGRFPQINFDDDKTQEIMQDVIKKTLLPAAMEEVANDGSVGSGALLIKIINSNIYYESLKTEYLTPVFDPKNPYFLIKLTQKYKVKGYDLLALDYKIKYPNLDYWYVREWDINNENYYIPWCSEDSKDRNYKPKIDTTRSIYHGLGFVPVVWIKNLSGGDFIDGKCTFKKGITTNIQLDYQLSQCGRGLTYSQEPLLFFKNPDRMLAGNITIGDGTTLVGGENSDAKMVEINGEGCMASIAYQEVLRKIVLENIHGNRSVPEKAGFAQSGKALEMLHHPLILLASRLRKTYGEIGLVNVVKLILKMIEKKEVLVEGKRIKTADIKSNSNVTLVWPRWFDSTADDNYKEATTLGELKNSGIISSETAIKNVAENYGIENVEEEIEKINSERSSFQKQMQPAVTEIFKS